MALNRNRSFVGNIKASPERTEKINKKLAELAKNSTAPMTLSEIAEKIGSSKQAVYQIEQGALRKIRKRFPKLLRELKH